jgi:glycerate 2-kinase
VNSHDRITSADFVKHTEICFHKHGSTMHHASVTKTRDHSPDTLVAEIIAALQPERLLNPAPGALKQALTDPRPITLVALGKAAAGCTRAVVPAVQSHPRSAETRGFIATVPEHTAALTQTLRDAGLAQVSVLPTDHPTPTERNLHAATQLADRLRTTPSNHQILALISGGGSAQLASPIAPLTLAELRELSASLMLAGADIHELNTVRRHLESLKNGGLLRCVPEGVPVTVVVLADVLADQDVCSDVKEQQHAVVRTVSSGPFHPGTTTPSDALAVLDHYKLRERFPDAVQVLADAASRTQHSSQSTTTGTATDITADITTAIAADNAAAVAITAEVLRDCGISPHTTRTNVVGPAEQIGRDLAHAAIDLATKIETLNSSSRSASDNTPTAIIWGGETTVVVANPDGLGGPCQHLAIAAALELAANPPSRQIQIIALATDGRDGPTTAAGAWIDENTATQARGIGLDLQISLDRDNTHPALDTLERLLVTGPAGTNLNDLMIAIINPPTP